MSLITKVNSDAAEAEKEKEKEKADPVKPLNPPFPFVPTPFKPGAFKVDADPPKRRVVVSRS